MMDILTLVSQTTIGADGRAVVFLHTLEDAEFPWYIQVFAADHSIEVVARFATRDEAAEKYVALLTGMLSPRLPAA